MTTPPLATAADDETAPLRANAKHWQLEHVDSWLATGRDPSTMRDRLAADFSEHVLRYLLNRIEAADDPEQIVEHLLPTLTSCDELAFHDEPSALTYLLWHQADRYHRVIQTLDMLFARGALPIARPTRSLKVLEVGSGPAPASYATIDYFAALGEWSEDESGDFAVSRRVETHALDRGRAWQRLIHGLSEQLLSAPSRARIAHFFGLQYTELSGFDPRRLHARARDDNKARMMSHLEVDDAHMWPVDSDGIDREAAALAPPSGYDLIIVANFVTNRAMMSTLREDLEALARSLTPGGVLLTLSGTSPDYAEIWADFTRLKSVRRLRHVVDEVVQAHTDTRVQRRVSQVTIMALRALESATGRDLAAVGLPNDIMRATRATGADEETTIGNVRYPRFQVHAFKKEGTAVTPRDQARVAARRRA